MLIGILVLVLSSRGSDQSPQRDVQLPPAEDTPSDIPQYDSTGYPTWDNYPDDFRSAFLSACSGNAMTDQCVCALEELEQRYTVDDFVNFGYTFPEEATTMIALICS